MINFYNYYNKTALWYAWQQPLVEQLRKRQYPKGLSEIEHIIKRSPVQTFYYIAYVIRGRWLDAEPNIMKDPYIAYMYARDIIKGRWQEAENVIMTDPTSIYRYATDILQHRWAEAEDAIQSDHVWWARYCREFNL